MSTIIGIIIALLVLSLLVVVHEGGHFLTAKAVGVKVNEFSVGMGPLIFQRKKGETQYSLRAVPIGGYVAMEGESEESEDERAFINKPWWARALVLFAGPFMNILFAMLILSAAVTYAGTGVSEGLASVESGSPAYEAGLQAGDVITAVNDVECSDGMEAYTALGEAEAADTADTVDLTYEHDGKSTTVTLNYDEDEDGNKIVGVMFAKEHSILDGLRYGAVGCVNMEKMILDSFAQLLTGKGSVDDVAGPVGIVNVVNQAAGTGIFNMLCLMALLSINLGLFNLFPFPALDGGRLLFVFIRLFTGKAITDELENRVHYLGIMVLFSFMIFVTFHDVARIVTG